MSWEEIILGEKILQKRREKEGTNLREEEEEEEKRGKG